MRYGMENPDRAVMASFCGVFAASLRNIGIVGSAVVFAAAFFTSLPPLTV